jgi:hypothetical protein
VGNAALANLVRQLAHPIGRRGASVHLVVPGPFDSPRVDALVERRAQNSGQSTDAVREEMLAEYPQGRMPSVDDVCWAITTLLHPSASAMNGTATFLDGGIRRGLF